MKIKTIQFISVIIISLTILYSCSSTKSITAEKTITKVKQDSTNLNNNKASQLKQDKTGNDTFLDSLRRGGFMRREGNIEVTYSIIEGLPEYVRNILPNVVFFKTAVVMSDSYFVNAYYNGKTYNLRSFNYLVSCNHTDDADISQKFKCLLFWKSNNNCEILEFKEEIGKTIHDERYTFVAKVKDKWGILTYYINYNDKQFGEIYLYQEDKLNTIWTIENVK